MIRVTLRIAFCGLALYGLQAAWKFSPDKKPILSFEAASNRPAVTFLSWDTEGGDRVGPNLLRPDAGVSIQVLTEGVWRDVKMIKRRVEDGAARYDLRAGQARLAWEIESGEGNLSLSVKATKGEIASVRLALAYDPKVTPMLVPVRRSD
jgi:hypothetical protein